MQDLDMAWQVSQVKAELSPLSWHDGEADAMLPPAIDAYNRYYKIDFEHQLKGVQHHVGYFDAHGFRIVAHVYRVHNAKGTVLLQHGYYDHVGLYGSIIEHCLKQGYNVFTYDLPGHGLSTGERAGIVSFQQYDQVFCDGLALCQQHLPGPLSVIGQSTGGAIIVNYLLSRHISRENSPFKQIYLLAPLVRPVSWNLSLLFFHVARWFIRRMKRTFTENTNNPSFVEFISRHDPLQPLYLQVSWVNALKDWITFIEGCPAVDLDIHVLQGNEDGTVDFRHNQKVLAEKFTGHQVTYLQGGRHHLANESPEHLQKVLAFLAF